MAGNLRDHKGMSYGDTAPAQVIKHMIALADYAETNGFPAFEARLLEAVEAFLNELNETDRPVRDTPVVNNGANVVPFCPALRRAVCDGNL